MKKTQSVGDLVVDFAENMDDIRPLAIAPREWVLPISVAITAFSTGVLATITFYSLAH